MRPVDAWPEADAAALKVPPHSIEAEQSVLGGLLLDSAGWDEIAGLVGEEDFYRASHRLIFRAFGDLCEAGLPVDVLLLAERLAANGKLEQAGGLAYLGGLAANTPSAANIKAYATLVRGRAILRQLLAASSETIDECFRPEGMEVDMLLDRAEARILAVGRARITQGVGTRDALAEVYGNLEMRQAHPGLITGIGTGLTDFDGLTGGLQPEDLMIIGARPSVGKTALAMNIVEHVLLTGGAVMVFSLEMGRGSLLQRMLCSIAEVNSKLAAGGYLDDRGWGRVKVARARIAEVQDRLHIEDAPGITPGEVRALARRAHRKQHLALVVLDYIQLMSIPGTRENRNIELGEISRGLKNLARELRAPVIALSQLNRLVEGRANHRPMLADLRESGNLEADADIVALLYRDEMYNSASPDRGTAELNVVKHRNGPTGMVKLAFRKDCVRFGNLMRE